MQRLEVSCAIRHIYKSLGAKGLTILYQLLELNIEESNETIFVFYNS